MVGDLAISNGHGRFIGGIYNGYGFLKLIAVNGSESTLIQLETGASKVPFVEKSVNGINVSTIPIALAEPPQKYNLPLASGLHSQTESIFYKNQFGQVLLDFGIHKQEGVFGENLRITTLPEGFRPQANKAIGVTAFEPIKGYFASVVVLDTDGSITLDGSAKNATILRGNFSFLAA